jgi:alcohol dehydrogenase (cytochrome c)
VLLGLASCGEGRTPGLSARSAGRGDARAAGGATIGVVGAPGEWVTQGKDYAQTRFSPLDQINTRNVGGLKYAWSFSTGVVAGHEGAPLVVGSTMYLVTPYPNIAYALDLTKNPPAVRWKYEPKPDNYAVGKACCDVVNRGWAYADGKLIYNLLDAHTVAVDAATGREVWRTKMADVREGVTMTMAPLVVKGKVLVGNSGGEMGTHGWLAALDVDTGKELWRAYSTGPDSLVKIGPRYRAFYPWLNGEDLGVTTWPGEIWKHGAGAVWGWISYDPELDLIYYGTSNPGPWNAEQRPGLNLFTSAVFARDPDTGEAVWAYQFTPHDMWDYDGVNENILVDLPIDGRMRRTMVQFNRNGFAYTIDRTTGEVLVAQPFGYLNWSTGVDLKTGMPRVVPEKTTHAGVWTRDICPADIGVKDQQPAAYSPRTGLFYVPTQHICMDYLTHETSYIAGTPYWATQTPRHPGPGGNYGEFIAWDAATGRKVWGIEEALLPYSGVVVTAGDVVFYGNVEGVFKAVDARDGRVLWQQKLGSGIIGAPITYLGPDGRQYVAVLAGVGGAAAVLAAEPGYSSPGGMLYVFALDPPPVGGAVGGAGFGGEDREQRGGQPSPAQPGGPGPGAAGHGTRTGTP